MTPYWLMFLVLALPSLVSARSAQTRRDLPGWIAVGVVLLLFIGFRHEVGGDWGNYIGQFMIFQRHDLGSVLLESDPGYAYLNWQLGQWGFGIYAVSMVCALFFTLGLMVFARQQPYPWLALAVAFPYLVNTGDPPALLGRHAQFDRSRSPKVTPMREPPSYTQRRNHETSKQFKSHSVGV